MLPRFMITAHTEVKKHQRPTSAVRTIITSYSLVNNVINVFHGCQTYSNAIQSKKKSSLEILGSDIIHSNPFRNIMNLSNKLVI